LDKKESYLKIKKMKTNVEKLEDIGILNEIRQRLGAEDELDESKDEKINNLSNHQLISAWCAWELGDKSWWDKMKQMFDRLEELDKI
jgi:hypothetical protein